MPYPPSPSTTFPFPPYTAAWRAPTPSRQAAANALTLSRVWTAWLPPSHTAPRPTAPPAIAWTLSPQATSTASMARVSKPCIDFYALAFRLEFLPKEALSRFSKAYEAMPSSQARKPPDLCTLLVEADTCS